MLCVSVHIDMVKAQTRWSLFVWYFNSKIAPRTKSMIKVERAGKLEGKNEKEPNYSTFQKSNQLMLNFESFYTLWLKYLMSTSTFKFLLSNMRAEPCFIFIIQNNTQSGMVLDGSNHILWHPDSEQLPSSLKITVPKHQNHHPFLSFLYHIQFCNFTQFGF
jgi:hypothetical protein